MAAAKATAKKPAQRQTGAKTSGKASTKAGTKAKKKAGRKAGSRRRVAPGRAGTAPAARRGPVPPLLQTLCEEHRYMASVMKMFAGQLDAIESGELVDTHVVYEVLDYMVTWPDRFHHPREDLIYARVAELSSQGADDVDTLQRDHDQTAARGRELLREIQRWRAGEITGTPVVEQGREYIAHIHEHMNLEEQVVFPRIERTLTLQDWRELAEEDDVQAVSTPVFGPRVQREFRNMARKLRRGMRSSAEHGAMVQWVDIDAAMESLDVVAIAYESARDVTTDHVRGALRDAVDIVRETPLSAPWRCFTNNTRVTLRILAEVAEISRETIGDLSRVNQERKDRIRLLQRQAGRR